MKFLITGDCHGNMDRFLNLPIDNPEEVGIIILGDAGLNYYKNKRDAKLKTKINQLGYTFYLVRGNHEDRPQNLPNMAIVYDEEVCGPVYTEPAWPQIRYLLDGETYYFNDHKTLVVGGAYSVDKEYRLLRQLAWFKDEQLTTEELDNIKNKVQGQTFDFVFSHTCPIDWEPKDLFLGFIDQSRVDKNMERGLNRIKDSIDWSVWCFGHFHADRLEDFGIEQFYQSIKDLDGVWETWHPTGIQPFEYRDGEV